MRNTEYTVKDLLKGVARAFRRVASELGGAPEYTLVFLRRLGWNVPLDTSVGGTASAALQAAQAIDDVLSGDDVDIVELAKSIRDFISSVDTVAGDLDLAMSAEFRAELATDLPAQLRDFLIVRHLETEHPRVSAFLAALGIIYSVHQQARPPHRLPHVRKEIRWGVLRGVLSAPGEFASRAFGWGTPSFDGSRLIDAIDLVCGAFDLEVARFAPTRALRSIRAVGGDALYFQFVDWPELSIGAELYRVRNAQDDGDVGIALAPHVASDAGVEVPLSESVSVGVEGSLRFARQTGVEVTPAGASVFGIGVPPPPAGSVALSLVAAPPGGLITIGDPTGTHFAIPKLRFRLPISINAGNPDLGLELLLERSRLVLASTGADSFVRTILCENRIEGQFELGLGIDRARGLYLMGSGIFEVEIPLHHAFDSVTIESIRLGAVLDEGRLSIPLSATMKAELGPIAVSVADFGVRIAADTTADAEADLDLGPVRLDAAFLPPTGAGLSVSADPMRGGGFLTHDESLERYAGIVDLKLGEIGLTGVGIITTKLPDDNEGYALFVNIAATFSPPITLPFNLSLQACGGLLALNRTMDIEALRSGLRSHTLDSILFPEDPIRNADKIISDSERVFPIEEGRFIVGPMAKVGWGANGLIVADIATIIELPPPLVIAVLGQLTAMMPKSDDAIIVLHLDVLGVLDMAKKSLAIDGTLYDSRILVYDLWGDAALRLTWGSSPMFGLSLGGWHPKFSSPPAFPTLRRLTVQLSSSSNFKLSCTAYQALTSNTLQFGAALSLRAKACGVTIRGDLSMDTLICFSPFEFEVAICAKVSASFKGHNIASLRVTLNLSGPTPWHARGKAKLSILWWDVSVRFSFTWGRDNKAIADRVDPRPQFLQEVRDIANWHGALPDRRTAAESFKSLQTEANVLLVHPAGSIEVRQRLLPLGMRLDKFANADVKDHFEFDLGFSFGVETAEENQTANVKVSSVDEHFALGQFKALTDEDRLSKPSYELFKAGVRAGPSEPRIDGSPIACELEYESIVIKADDVSAPPAVAKARWIAMKRVLRTGASRRAGLRKQGLGKFSIPGAPKIRVSDEAYTIVDTTTLLPAATLIPQDRVHLTQTAAEQLVEAAVAENRVKRGSVIVVPVCEAEAAA